MIFAKDLLMNFGISALMQRLENTFMKTVIINEGKMLEKSPW